jgi:hypothetical protein
MSVQEVFLSAREAMQEWVDADENRALISTGDLETVRRDPWIVSLIQAYHGYGAVMAEKLWKHLGFLVENRRGFYASRR